MVDEIVTFDEIANYLNAFLEKRYKDLRGEYETLLEASGLLKKHKDDYIKKQRNLISDIFEIYTIYSYYDLLLKKASTFERKQIAKMFKTFYSALYKKEFTILNIKGNIVVAAADDLGNNTTVENLNIEDLLANSQDTCIVLSHPSYTLLDGPRLSSDFASFPEIMPIARRLIDLYIVNPEMSDRLRMDEALEYVVNNLEEGLNPNSLPISIPSKEEQKRLLKIQAEKASQ